MNIRQKIIDLCNFIISKLDNKNLIQNDSNLLQSYTKVPIDKIILNNTGNLISKDIYLFNITDDGGIEPHVKSCENSYKKYNPDFNIHLINIKRNDFYKHEMCKNIVEELKLKNEDLNSNFNKIYDTFIYAFLYTQGGIICSTKTYCCKSFEDLVRLDNFSMSKYNLFGCFPSTHTCFGVKKQLDKKLSNVVYPPVNYNNLLDGYDIMKILFYSGKELKDNKVAHKKLQPYLYDFS